MKIKMAELRHGNSERLRLVSLPLFLYILITTHYAKNTQEGNEQVEHIKIQCQCGGDVFICTVVAQYVRSVIENETLKSRTLSTRHYKVT